MQAPSPSVQLQTEGQQSEIGAAPGLEPSLTGPAPALWAGFAAFVVVFVVVLMLIIRGRVIRPAARKAAAPADFFEPAGETAEITFDDDAPVAQQDRHPGNAAADGEDANEEKTPEKAETKPKRSAFSGLFAKKQKSPPDAPPAAPTAPEDASAQNAYDLLAGDEDEFAPPRPDEETTLRASSQSIPAQLKTMDDDVEARRREAEDEELRRLEAKEDAEEQARQRERSAAAALAAFPRAHAGTEPAQAQSSHQSRSAPQPDPQHFAAMQRALETTFAERLASLAQDMHQRLGALEARVETQIETQMKTQTKALAAAATQADKPDFEGVSEAHFAEFANLIGEQLETLREASTTSIEAMSRRLDRVDAAPEGLAALSKNVARLNLMLGGAMAATTAGRLQLADILANALPPGRYALARKLSSGKTVDALVHPAEMSTPVAIDARFPVEAFDAYEQSRIENGQVEATETEFRRLMLRRIVDIAEKQIAPGETADCALMFIPSEHMLTTLYARFSDIVQESYRARIWMVSPSSLTASLYTISALIGARPGDDTQSIAENTDYGSTAEAMNGAHDEEQADQPPQTVPEPEPATAAGSASHSGEAGKTAAAPAHGQSETPSGTDEAPSFPLR